MSAEYALPPRAYFCSRYELRVMRRMLELRVMRRLLEEEVGWGVGVGFR